MGKRIKVAASKEEADFSSMRCSLEKMFQEEMLHLSYATNTITCHDFQDLWRKHLYLVCLNLEPCCCSLSSEDFESEKQGKESICYGLSVSVQEKQCENPITGHFWHEPEAMARNSTAIRTQECLVNAVSALVLACIMYLSVSRRAVLSLFALQLLQ